MRVGERAFADGELVDAELRLGRQVLVLRWVLARLQVDDDETPLVVALETVSPSAQDDIVAVVHNEVDLRTDHLAVIADMPPQESLEQLACGLVLAVALPLRVERQGAPYGVEVRHHRAGIGGKLARHDGLGQRVHHRAEALRRRRHPLRMHLAIEEPPPGALLERRHCRAGERDASVRRAHRCHSLGGLEEAPPPIGMCRRHERDAMGVDGGCELSQTTGCVGAVGVGDVVGEQRTTKPRDE